MFIKIDWITMLKLRFSDTGVLIKFVRMYAYVCVYHPRLPLTSGVMWHDMDSM